MTQSNPGLKRFRDHDLFPLVVCVLVTAVCAGIVWLVVTRFL